MSELDRPVTFGDLLDAIDGCGEAFGEALHRALARAGTDRAQLVSIAADLHEASSNDQRMSPAAHCGTAIATGFLTAISAADATKRRSV
ncbi:hypothetical protein [uncultured Pseudacidovorax sp.]|uniref:hypothetical protein n=1 Tax=uncultured Pseudacidovorax sp. TaxID=679313 RepID=UPI0025E7F60E|nr:hypothetical protein [uncultured Pseudacidovorax sp.]